MVYLEKERLFQAELLDMRGVFGERPPRTSPESIMRHGLDCLILDVDSTLIQEEGIDMLARLRGEGMYERIAQMTKEAMTTNGNTAEIFFQRLALIQPTREELEQIGRDCCQSFVENAQDVVEMCQALCMNIHLVSGGYLPIIRQVADHLKIPSANVHGNIIHFRPDGPFDRLETDTPLWTKVGKPWVIQHLITQGRIYPNIGLIGDGGTDAATIGDVGVFIGFGGVARRADVEEQSSFYITCPSLAPLAVIAAGEVHWLEVIKHSNYKEILIKGFKMISDGKVILKGQYKALLPRVERFCEKEGINLELV